MKRRGDDWWIVWAIFLGSPFIILGIIIIYTPTLAIAEKLPSFLSIFVLVSPLLALGIGREVYRTRKNSSPHCGRLFTLLINIYHID